MHNLKLPSGVDVERMGRHHLEAVRAKMRYFQVIKTVLARTIARCTGFETPDCPLMSTGKLLRVRDLTHGIVRLLLQTSDNRQLSEVIIVCTQSGPKTLGLIRLRVGAWRESGSSYRLRQ
jgi:hypothetical protein